MCAQPHRQRDRPDFRLLSMSRTNERGQARASRARHSRHHSWLHEHSLSVLLGAVLLTWLLLYWRSDPGTHLGAFYGNAAADWFGSFVTVVATKFWYESGSAESRVPSLLRGKGPKFLHEHSLSVVLV